MTATMAPPVTSKVSYKRRIVIGRKRTQTVTERVAEASSSVRRSVRNIWMAIVDRFRRTNAFIQYSVFFGLAIAGSTLAWVVLDVAVFWAILVPLMLLGYPNLALWSAIIVLLSTWAAATVVWFAKLDEWFRF